MQSASTGASNIALSLKIHAQPFNATNPPAMGPKCGFEFPSISNCLHIGRKCTYTVGYCQRIDAHKAPTLALEEHITNLVVFWSARKTILTSSGGGKQTVAAPIARETEPTPAKMRETIAPPNVVAYADPMLLAMATMVKNYRRLGVSAEQEVGRLPHTI
jgi:hypothetical protein